MSSSRFNRFVAATAVAVCLGAVQTPGAIAGGQDHLAFDGIAVKIDVLNGGSVIDVLSSFPVRLDSTLLASRGIYLVQPTDAQVAADPKKSADLAKQIKGHQAVDYAELNVGTALSDQRGFRAWPNGVPVTVDADAAWRSQRLVGELELARAHQMSRGLGTTVAVLDTGVDVGHDVLQGRTVPGYDYIGDDVDPAEDRSGQDGNGNGIVDEAFGHGTFVAGTVLLVAPDTQIMPMRVLDSDGTGNTFVLAAAITDAVDHGADVLNLSLGTADDVRSKVLAEALKYAKDRRVMVVAAAGNDGCDDPTYPAVEKEVLSVGSVGEDSTGLSPFSNYGDKVDVAAPAERVVGPMPGQAFAVWSGTSMAAPQVSGQLALMRSAGGSSDVKKQREGVTKTAHELVGHHTIKSGEIDVVDAILRLRR